MLAFEDARIRRRERRLVVGNGSETETIRLPFGVGITPDDYHFQKRNAKTGNWEVRAQLNGDERSERYTILKPGYEATDHIKDPDTGSKVLINLWVVYSDRDRLGSRQVIQRVHYLADNGRGLIVACKFSDPQEQLEIRKHARRRKGADLEDISWVLPLGGIVGCGVIDTLWHGNPINGRALIAEKLGFKGDKWKSWSRSETVERMRVAWASRFAVDAPYQGLGLGTAIARHLKKIARLYRAPTADFLEVITTVVKDQDSVASRDFLTEAGYTRLAADMKSRTVMVMDKETGYAVPKSAVKRYYYTDLRDGL